jgi:hypothetical protein
MTNLYRGPSTDVSYQVSVHLAEGFRRRLKCEKLTDGRRRTTDAMWWQKLTLPLARWAKKEFEVPKGDTSTTIWSFCNEYIFFLIKSRDNRLMNKIVAAILPYVKIFHLSFGLHGRIGGFPIGKIPIWRPKVFGTEDVSLVFTFPSIMCSLKLIDSASES